MSDILIHSGVTVGAFSIGFFLIRVYIKDLKTDLCAKMDKQFDRCAGHFTTIESENKEQWDALHTHGHKALDQNGSTVTR